MMNFVLVLQENEENFKNKTKLLLITENVTAVTGILAGQLSRDKCQSRIDLQWRNKDKKRVRQLDENQN